MASQFHITMCIHISSSVCSSPESTPNVLMHLAPCLRGLKDSHHPGMKLKVYMCAQSALDKCLQAFVACCIFSTTSTRACV